MISVILISIRFSNILPLLVEYTMTANKPIKYKTAIDIETQQLTNIAKILANTAKIIPPTIKYPSSNRYTKIGAALYMASRLLNASTKGT